MSLTALEQALAAAEAALAAGDARAAAAAVASGAATIAALAAPGVALDRAALERTRTLHARVLAAAEAERDRVAGVLATAGRSRRAETAYRTR